MHRPVIFKDSLCHSVRRSRLLHTWYSVLDTAYSVLLTRYSVLGAPYFVLKYLAGLPLTVRANHLS
jgi:hypothetical protein